MKKLLFIILIAISSVCLGQNRYDKLFKEADSVFYHQESYVVKWTMLTENPEGTAWTGPKEKLSKTFHSKPRAIHFAIQLTKWNIYKEVRMYKVKNHK